jgi:hypothetical protein
VTRYTLIGIFVLLFLVALLTTSAPLEEAREGSLYESQSIQPIFRGLPPEAGK